jgi:hypothetical protein
LSNHSREIIYKKYDNLLPDEDFLEIMKSFEKDNEILHEKFFKNIDINEFNFKFRKSNTTELEELRCEIEKVKDVVAMQMDLIFELCKLVKVN